MSLNILVSRENLQGVEEDIKAKANKLVADGKLYESEGKLYKSLKCFIKADKLIPSEKIKILIKQIEDKIAEDEEDDDTMEVVELDNGLKKLVERLYPHQINGVKWMYNLFKNGKKGGILADDMGLGKTIQMIAFISAMFDMQRIRNVLLVVPLSVIPSWVAEFKSWAPGIRVECFHGAASKRKAILRQCMTNRSVCITTYGLIVTEWQALGETIDGREFVWDYIALDEGHRIKNPSKTTKRLHNIPSRNRIILTGTPVQNKVRDLWALMDWVTQGSLLGTKKTFHSDYELPIERARHRNSSASEIQLGNSMAASLKKLTDPYILRRTKASLSKEEKENASPVDANKVADGNHDLSTLCHQPTFPKLSTKNDFVVWVYLSDVQQKIYRNFIELDDVKALLTNHQSPLVYLTILKKICDHPRLLSTKACLELGLQSNNDSISEDMNCSAVEECAVNRIHNIPDETLINESGKLQFLIDLLLRLRDEGHRTLIFSMSRKMLNIIQRILINHKFKIMRLDGRVTKMGEREERVRKFQEDPSYHVFLLTTKVAGVGLTLTAADRVVICDPSWNPAIDDQAIGRLYRIGQKKSVAVYRLITCGSVEEKIYRRQIFKNSVIQQAVQGQKDPFRYFTRQELFELFSLDDVTKSDTQLQLMQLHGHQRNLDAHMQTHIKFIHELKMFGVSDHDLMFTRKADDFDEDETQAELFNNKVEKAQNRLKLESDQLTGHRETESRWGMFTEERRNAQIPVKDLEPIYPIEGISDKLEALSLPSKNETKFKFDPIFDDLPDIKKKMSNKRFLFDPQADGIFQIKSERYATKDEPSSSNWTRSETPQIEDSFDTFDKQVSSDEDPEQGDEEWKTAFARADETNEQEQSSKSLHTNEPEVNFDAIFDDLPDIKKKMSVHSTNADSALVATTRKRPIIASNSGNASDNNDDELSSLASILSQSLNQSEADSSEKEMKQTADDDVSRPSAGYVSDLDDEKADDVIGNLSEDVLCWQEDAIGPTDDVINDNSDTTEILDSPNKSGSCFNDSDVGNDDDDDMEQLIDDDGSEASVLDERSDDVEEAENRLKLESDQFTGHSETESRWGMFNEERRDAQIPVKDLEAIYPIEGISDKLEALSLPSKSVHSTTAGSVLVATTTRKRPTIASDLDNSSNNSDDELSLVSILSQSLNQSEADSSEKEMKQITDDDVSRPFAGYVSNNEKADEVIGNLNVDDLSWHEDAIGPADDVINDNSDTTEILDSPNKSGSCFNDSDVGNDDDDDMEQLIDDDGSERSSDVEMADDASLSKEEKENASSVDANKVADGNHDLSTLCHQPTFTKLSTKNDIVVWSVHSTNADSALVATTRKRPIIASNSGNASNNNDDELSSLASILSQSLNQSEADSSEKEMKQITDDDVSRPSAGYVIGNLSEDVLCWQEDAIGPTDDVINDNSDTTEILDSPNKSGSCFNDSDVGNDDDDDMEQLIDDDGSEASVLDERSDDVEEAQNRLKLGSDQLTGHSETESRWGMFTKERRDAQIPVKDLEPIYPKEGISDKLEALSLPSKSVHSTTAGSVLVATTTRKRPIIASDCDNSSNNSDDELSSLASILSQSLNQSEADSSEKEMKQITDDDVSRPSAGYISDLDDEKADDVIGNLSEDVLCWQEDAIGPADDVINDNSDTTEILDSPNKSGSCFNDSDVGNDDDDDMEQLIDDDGSEASVLDERSDDVEEAQNRLKLGSDQFTGHSETESRWGMFNEERRDAQIPVRDLEAIYPIEGISDKLEALSLPSKGNTRFSFNPQAGSTPKLKNKSFAAKIEDSFDNFGEQLSNEEGDDEWKTAFSQLDETNEQEQSRKSLHTSVHSTNADSPLVATTTRKRPIMASDLDNSSNNSDDELSSLASIMSQSLNQSEANSSEKEMKQTADDDVSRPSAGYVSNNEKADEVTGNLSVDDLSWHEDAIGPTDDAINDNSDTTEILDSPNKSGSCFDDSDVGNDDDDDMEQLIDDDGSERSSDVEMADDMKMTLS